MLLVLAVSNSQAYLSLCHTVGPSVLKDVERRRQRNADEWPVVVLLLRVHLLAVVLAQMVLCQTLVHLSENRALSALLWAHEANHEGLLDTEAEHALDIGTDHLQVHQADNAVLEQVLADLVDVQALVLELLLEADELLGVVLPQLEVVFEWFDNDVVFAAGLEHVVQLLRVDQRVVHGVTLTICDLRLAQDWHDRAGHALFGGFIQGLLLVTDQELFDLAEKLEVFVFGGDLALLLVQPDCDLMREQFVELVLPRLQLL